MNNTGPAKPSMVYWIVGMVSLLWNAFGAWLYTNAKLNPEATLAAAPPAMRDYIANMPLWGHIGWSVGIWASLLGALLLLIRSRHAVTAFLVSGLGAVASYAAQALAGVLTPAEPAMILGAIALQWWWARKQAAAGNLR